MRFCISLILACAIGCVCSPATQAASGADARCLKFFKSKQFLKAGECFEGLAQALGASQGLPEEKKNLKGRMLRNAAIAFRKYALQLKPAQGAKWRLRALKHLKTYQEDKLCETPERCRLTQALARSIRREVGYTPLTITTGDPNSLIELNGDVFNDKGKSNQMKWKVPPGAYVVVVTYPGQSPISKKITITKGQPGLVAFKDKSKVRKAPTIIVKGRSAAPLILLITGAVIVAAGGALLGAGLGMNAGMQQAVTDLKRERAASNLALKKEDTDDFLAQYDTQQTLAMVGWIGLGVGAAVLLGGVIWGGAQGGFTASQPKVIKQAVLPPAATRQTAVTQLLSMQ